MRQSVEDVVLEFFQQQPLPAAELMLKICAKAVKRRQAPRAPLTAAKQHGAGKRISRTNTPAGGDSRNHEHTPTA